MKKASMPEYQALSRALEHTVHKLHPSEAHGVISGILSGNPKSKIGWEEWVTGGGETAKTRVLLNKLYAVSARQLNDFLFEFQLLLPPDTENLPVRAEALTLWCQGYLTGLKQVEVKLEGHSSSHMTEAIKDMVEIAKMNYEEVVASEEDEVAYSDLVEYVRMAVILIYQEMHEPDDVIGALNHLH